MLFSWGTVKKSHWAKYKVIYRKQIRLSLYKKFRLILYLYFKVKERKLVAKLYVHNYLLKMWITSHKHQVYLDKGWSQKILTIWNYIWYPTLICVKIWCLGADMQKVWILPYQKFGFLKNFHTNVWLTKY